MLRVALRRLVQSTTALESTRPLLQHSQRQLLDTEQKRWATKKAGGTVKNSSDSKPKYLGVKKFGGEWCQPGNIIIRQRGQKYRPGEYVGMGRDFTIWALVEGQVKFWKEFVKSPVTRRCRKKTHVSVVPGKKPEKRKREPLSWFACKRRERRQKREAQTRRLKEQKRLFLYKLPKVTVLGSA